MCGFVTRTYPHAQAQLWVFCYSFLRSRTGAQGSTQAGRQAAVVQELSRRHNVACPAHPSSRDSTENHRYSTAQKDGASHLVLASVAAAAKLELHLVDSFDISAASDGRWVHTHSPSADSVLWDSVRSAGLWANFCVTHDLTKRFSAANSRSIATSRETSSSLRKRHLQLQAAFPDINVSSAVAKDPQMLLYCPTTLVRHMQHLQLLVGKSEASAMVAKMPSLLHYKTTSLSAKLDAMYDLLPKADISKVLHRSQDACSTRIFTIIACLLHFALPAYSRFVPWAGH